jgi:hypothetical protein
LSASLTIRRFTAPLALLLACSPFAHSAERITLSNGFELRCDHHAEVDGRTRLYLIVSIETLPDPPSAPKSSAPSAPVPAGPHSTQNAKLSEADLGEMLTQAGRAHNLDVDLLASLVKAESGGNSRAISPAGARGLMQLMPGTAKDLGVADSFKPDDNVRGGSTYLDALLTRYHDNLALALAAYNAGPDAVYRYHGIPPYNQTRAYVARVIHEFNRRVLAREAEAKHAAVQAKPPANPAAQSNATR